MEDLNRRGHLDVTHHDTSHSGKDDSGDATAQNVSSQQTSSNASASAAIGMDVDSPPGDAENDASSVCPPIDLVDSIEGMYRILDLVAEQSSGGLGKLCRIYK